MTHKRKHIRWRRWDYSSLGAYFVTICTKRKYCYFGGIKKDLRGMGENKELPFPELDSYLISTPIAKIAYQHWLEIPKHYPFVALDAFVIMPNHLHGILIFDKEISENWNTNTFGPQKDNLPDVIRTYKASVKRKANKTDISFFWQSRYHDRVIRNYLEMKNIQNYIWNNPANWDTDLENPDRT